MAVIGYTCLEVSSRPANFFFGHYIEGPECTRKRISGEGPHDAAARDIPDSSGLGVCHGSGVHSGPIGLAPFSFGSSGVSMPSDMCSVSLCPSLDIMHTEFWIKWKWVAQYLSN
jgi:hypothetical protein